jgi:hypothetical protein
MHSRQFVDYTTECGVVWKHKELEKWMLAATELTSDFFLLMHFTMGAARGEEYASFALRNTKDMKRVFFFLQGTVMTVQTYYKGATKIIPQKPVARFLPKVFAPAFVTYLTLVRPAMGYVNLLSFVKLMSSVKGASHKSDGQKKCQYNT